MPATGRERLWLLRLSKDFRSPQMVLMGLCGGYLQDVVKVEARFGAGVHHKYHAFDIMFYVRSGYRGLKVSLSRPNISKRSLVSHALSLDKTNRSNSRSTLDE